MTTDRVIEVIVPQATVQVVGVIQGEKGPIGLTGPTGPQGTPGIDGFSIVTNALDHGVAGTGLVDDTAAINAFMTDAWPYPKKYYFPTSVGYVISGTISLPQSSTVWGQGRQGTRFYPGTGQATPAFDLAQPGTELKDIAIWNFVNSMSAGVPAIVMGGQQQKLMNIDIRSLKGDGVHVTVQNQSSLKNVMVASCTGNGFTVATTYTLLDSCIASGNGGHGFVLKDSSFANGSGILTGCVAENNTGHGYYVIGGDWELSVYGEANGGDLLHVDGMQQFDTTMTLAADAHVGDSSITVSALSKGLPARSILRFADGNIALISNNGAGPVINLAVALTVDKPSGSVLTLAPEDVHPSRLPTVHLHSGTHDGNISLHACNYSISANFPISANVLATPSARLIGEPLIKGRSHTVTVNYGGGGSEAMGALVGAAKPMIANGLSATANPTNLYFLTGTAGAPVRPDTTIPGGFYHRLTSQFQLTLMPNGWDLKNLTPGEYTVRALVRDASQTANNIDLIVATASTTTFTTRTATWEWIAVDFTMTDAIRAAGGAQSIAVQRKTVTSNVDVAVIQVVPKFSSVVLPGTWQNPTVIGSHSDGISLWKDASDDLRFVSGVPTSDGDGDAVGSGGGGGGAYPNRISLDYTDPITTAGWSNTVVAPGAIAAVRGGYRLSNGDAVQRDEEFDVGMKAGTWTMTVWYTKYVNAGNLSVIVDGTESTVYDAYAASAAVTGSTFTATIATDGIKTIKIRQKGTKNASSSAYYVFWSTLTGYTT